MSKIIQLRRHPELGTVHGQFRDRPVPGSQSPGSFYLSESVVGGYLWIGQDDDLGLLGIDEELAAELWPLIKTFAETGRLPEPEKEDRP